MTLCHNAFSRQRREQFSEDVYAFVLWRFVVVQVWRVKELFVPDIVASTIKSDFCNNMDHMYNSGTQHSSVILRQRITF